MDINDMILLSIDDHIIEPADTFAAHFPASMKDDAPKLVKHPDNPAVDAWIFQGVPVGSPGLSAVVSWPKEDWSFDPVGLAEMRPGTYDIHQRVRDMNVNGVLAGMNFPTFPGFAGTHLASLPDRKLSLAAIKAYNDFLLDDLCGAYPGRFIPMGIIPFFDIDESVKEIHRLAAKGVGCRSITMPETPYGVGQPDFASGHWDPVFKALVDTNMVASMHIGGGFGLIKRPDVTLPDDIVILAALVSTIAASDLLTSGVLKRIPDIKFAMSEGGLGWIPFLLDRMDRHMVNHSWTHLDSLPKGKTPTEVWKDNFLACFITEPTALQTRERYGTHTIGWECDYPHSDCTWPYSPELLLKELQAANCSDKEIDMITHENVANFFSWDPFSYTPKDQATVGALRALATDVDTSTTSKEQYRARYEAAQA
ncbi:MAG: amidohydrolase family protein [Candidatus Nanopelagicales bacterium]|nr:amidohydrolase family protein [Candidatus Nanopelagicales bacterium]